MDIREAVKGDRGVSPVIGVILMVAITVILAAVIGSFVLGIGGDVQKAPQASLSVDHADGVITHNGGDTLNMTDIKVTDGGGASPYTWDVSSHTEFGPGETITVDSSGFTGTVRVVHQPSGNVILTAEE